MESSSASNLSNDAEAAEIEGGTRPDPRVATNRRLSRTAGFGRAALGPGWHAGRKAGQFVYASRENLEAWLARESAGEPVHLAGNGIDLTAELKRGLSYMRQQKRIESATKKAS